MTIKLNGETLELGDSTITVRGVLSAKGWSFPLIIVRLNGVLVPRSEWDSRAVAEGDAMDAMHLVSGG